MWTSQRVPSALTMTVSVGLSVGATKRGSATGVDGRAAAAMSNSDARTQGRSSTRAEAECRRCGAEGARSRTARLDRSQRHSRRRQRRHVEGKDVRRMA